MYKKTSATLLAATIFIISACGAPRKLETDAQPQAVTAGKYRAAIVKVGRVPNSALNLFALQVCKNENGKQICKFPLASGPAASAKPAYFKLKEFTEVVGRRNTANCRKIDVVDSFQFISDREIAAGLFTVVAGGSTTLGAVVGVISACTLPAAVAAGEVLGSTLAGLTLGSGLGAVTAALVYYRPAAAPAAEAATEGEKRLNQYGGFLFGNKTVKEGNLTVKHLEVLLAELAKATGTTLRNDWK